MKLDVYSKGGEVTGEVEVSEKIFGAEVKPHLFWEVVRWQNARRRSGTHESQTRAVVTGTTKKVYRQKGTGNARHGSQKAPIYVGGGQAHGPHPRNYDYSLNKKVRAGALRSALSHKVQEGKLRVVEDFNMDRIKTKDAVAVISAFGVKKAVVVDLDSNENLALSVRNLPAYKHLAPGGLNVRDLLNHEMVILTRSALEQLEGRLG
jgi:large subunit ribosomal protein L4